MRQSIATILVVAGMAGAFALGFALRTGQPNSSAISDEPDKVGGEKRPAEEGATEEKKEPVAVEVATLRNGKLPVLLPCTGEVALKPDAVQTVSPRVESVVSEVLHRDGDAVHKGDAIAILDDRPVRALRIKAMGSVAEARAELDKVTRATSAVESEELDVAVREAQSTYDQAVRTVERQQALAKDQLVASKQVDDAVRSRELAAAQLQAAKHKAELAHGGGQPEDLARLKARLAQAEADLQSADLSLSATIVRAERDGIISELSIQPGQPVQTNSVIAKVVDASPGNYECVLSIPVEDARAIHAGQPVRVQAKHGGGTDAASGYKVVAVGQTSEGGGGSVRVRAVPTNPEHASNFVPGEFVMAVIETGTTEDSGLLAPASALVPGDRDGEFAVIKVDGDGKTHRKGVELLARAAGLSSRDQTVAIRGGELDDGDSVVTAGSYNLPDDTQVTTTTHEHEK